jgi:thiamine-monophosphate kinase
VGIGDDAAVLRVEKRPLVWTIDAQVEGVHFRRAWLSLADIGARSFHAAASDLAAMGARPVAALSSLVVPEAMSARDVVRLARGQAMAARELSCPIVGGNLSRGGELGVTTTLLGAASTPLLRSGARPGDELWLIGHLGLAAAGLGWLAAHDADGRRDRRVTPATDRPRAPSLAPAERRAVRAALAAFRRPHALVRAGRGLAGRARAAIDVSDGLAADAARLADESGVRVVVERAALRRALSPELFTMARLLETDALELAVSGGEDYALLATGEASRRPRFARPIGRVEPGRNALLRDEQGALIPLVGGFDHFRLKRRSAR